MKLAAAYIRRSTTSATLQGETFEGQRRHIGEFARRNGYKIVKWYEDSASGLDVRKRPSFLQILEDARAGEAGFRYLLCYDVSRYGRFSPDEAAYFRHELRRCGVETVFSAEKLLGIEIPLPKPRSRR